MKTQVMMIDCKTIKHTDKYSYDFIFHKSTFQLRKTLENLIIYANSYNNY